MKLDLKKNVFLLNNITISLIYPSDPSAHPGGGTFMDTTESPWTLSPVLIRLGDPTKTPRQSPRRRPAVRGSTVSRIPTLR